MPKPTNARKARFRAALALAETTADEFALSQGVTPGHLSQVLSGKRISQKLMEQIDAFTREWLEKETAAAS